MKRGEIYFADLGIKPGSVQSGRRPVVIIQTDRLNRLGRTFIVVPLTTSGNASRLIGTVPIPKSTLNGLTSDSVALTFQIMTVDVSEFQSYLGTLEDHLIDQLHAEISNLVGP